MKCNKNSIDFQINFTQKLFFHSLMPLEWDFPQQKSSLRGRKSWKCHSVLFQAISFQFQLFRIYSRSARKNLHMQISNHRTKGQFKPYARTVENWDCIPFSWQSVKCNSMIFQLEGNFDVSFIGRGIKNRKREKVQTMMLNRYLQWQICTIGCRKGLQWKL